jgi:hypothetical protein
MLIQHVAPVAGPEFAPVFVALELSRSKWLVGVGTPQKWAVGRHEIEGGDLDGLLALLRRIAASEEKRAGLPVRVHVCFEAGRDGHWLYRALKGEGYEVYEIDPASVAVDRRARRVKSSTRSLAIVSTSRGGCGCRGGPKRARGPVFQRRPPSSCRGWRRCDGDPVADVREGRDRSSRDFLPVLALFGQTFSLFRRLRIP